MWTKFGNWFSKRVMGYCWHGDEHSVGAHQVCVTARSNYTLRYRQNIPRKQTSTHQTARCHNTHLQCHKNLNPI